MSSILRQAALVFWDFDGVIKESLEVKAEAYERLFQAYGTVVAARVRAHAEANGGMSRFEKMPLYLAWAGQEATAERVRELCDRFGDAVVRAVIDARWVPGVQEYLDARHAAQTFVLLSATPQAEMDMIIGALNLRGCFAEICGAPTPKAATISRVLRERCASPETAVMVGDADGDLDAARTNGVPFLLRRTPFNLALQQRYEGPSFCDLL